MTTVTIRQRYSIAKPNTNPDVPFSSGCGGGGKTGYCGTVGASRERVCTPGSCIRYIAVMGAKLSEYFLFFLGNFFVFVHLLGLRGRARRRDRGGWIFPRETLIPSHFSRLVVRA